MERRVKQIKLCALGSKSQLRLKMPSVNDPHCTVADISEPFLPFVLMVAVRHHRLGLLASVKT